MNPNENNTDFVDGEDTESKTKRKKEMLALQVLGEHLASLHINQLEKCQLPSVLGNAIDEYKRIPNRRGAKKRQLQFIGKLMRDVDVEPIQRVLDEESQQMELDKRRFQRLETIRDQLLAGDQSSLNELISKCPDLDIQYLRQLIRQSTKETKEGKPPAASRKIFTFLRELPELKNL
jgi:ribosome-associated protein